MAERESAFKLKQKDAPKSSEASDNSSLLGDLKENKRQVQAYRYWFENLEKDFSEPSALLAAIAKPSYNNDRLLAAGGGYLLRDKNEKFLERVRVENLRITPEQLALLQELLKERQAALAEQNVAETNLRGLEYYASQLGDKSDFSEPSALLAAIAKPSYNNDRLLAAGGGYLLRDKNEKFLERVRVENLRITPEQLALLQELSKFTSNSAIPAEIRENLRRFSTSRDPQTLQRIENSIDMNGATPIKDAIQVWASKFNKMYRSVTFEAGFYKKLRANESYEAIDEFLNAFEGKDSDDLALVAKFRGFARSTRRERFVREIAQKLGKSDRKYDAIIGEAEEFARDGDGADRRAAGVIIEAACTSEIAQFRNKVWQLVQKGLDPDAVRLAINALPIRATVGGNDYVRTVKDVETKVVRQTGEIEKISRLETANALRERFPKTAPDVMLEELKTFSVDTVEGERIKIELFDLYRSYLASERPGEFDERFAAEFEKQRDEMLKGQFISPELKNNRMGFEYLRENYYSVISPLIESFRADPTTREVIQSFVKDRAQYRQRLKALEQQRPLTDTEKAYFQSVEMLTIFNPYLVAAVYADPGVTSEYLRHHFDSLSRDTLADLKDGDYVPLIQVGLGPNGLAALGETVRNNPELARQMLIVDSGEQPGGPFAIPRGAAWELNSANRRGEGGPILPDPRLQDSDTKELERVRAYGSPLRWYPGERVPGLDVRQGSINTTVDYLPTPDDLSTARYPTNEELALILSLQASMLSSRVALQTRVLEVTPNLDGPKDFRGDPLEKFVRLSVPNPDGSEKQITLRTEAIFNSTGLGDPSFGFKIEGSRAEKVLKETADAPFPKLSTTLEAFGALSARTGEAVSPGKTLAIYGSGNSADTLIEFIGNIFQGGNPRVRDVTKIYVISENDLSARPRYAALADIKSRGGRANLIEFVKKRVADVDFADIANVPLERRLRLIDEKGEAIRTDDGSRAVTVDAVIAATGFRPQLDSVFAAYRKGEETFSFKSETRPTESLTLPTNPGVPVAETLKQDPNVLFLGTSSKPNLQGNVDKLDQLPAEAREALLRNGAENAVAIGFRAPDVQAAVNIWVNSRDITLDPTPKLERRNVAVGGDAGSVRRIDLTIDPSDLQIPDNMANETLLLSPFLSYELKNNGRLVDEKGGFTGELRFDILFASAANILSLSYEGGEGAPSSISRALGNEIVRICEDKDFQRYAVSALRKKRRDPKLGIFIRYKDGRVDQQNTFVQT